MNYEIIKDEKILDDFIEFLPDLREGEVFYVGLYARKKYVPHMPNIKSDKSQLARFTATKENLKYKLRKLEIAVGAYEAKGGVKVPQEALAVYITINPRSLLKATHSGLKKFADLIIQKYNGYNPHQEILSEIHKAKSRTCYIDFDLDDYAADQAISEVVGGGLINVQALDILVTRGGVHLLVNPRKVSEKFQSTFYGRLEKLADVVGDNMVPIPGCVQGDFVPRMLGPLAVSGD